MSYQFTRNGDQIEDIHNRVDNITKIESIDGFISVGADVGAKVSTGSGVWKVVDSSSPVGLALDNGNKAIPLNGIWISDNGADITGQTVSHDEINSVFQIAKDNKFTAVSGSIQYLVGETILIKSNFNGSFCEFKASNTFTGDEVVNTDANSIRTRQLRVQPFDVNTKVTDLIGLRVSNFNCKFDDVNVGGFDFCWAINSFSCTLTNCLGTFGNTNLSAWAPSSSEEINALNILGGEWFGGRDYTFNIGDDRWPSSIDPNVSAHGSMLKIIGCTTDGGCIKLDKMINSEISCYFEAGDSPLQDSYIYLPNTGNTTSGVHIHDCNCRNSGTMEYFVRADSAIRGIKIDQIQYTLIPKCLFYGINQDTYPVQIGALYPTNSHQDAPQIHLGVRSGQSDNALSTHNIIGQLSDGLPVRQSYRRRTNVMDPEGNGMESTYEGKGWVNTNKPGDIITGTVVSTSTFRASNLSDIADLEAGMCVRVGADTGTTTYIRFIDYETGDISIDYYTLSSETELHCKEIKKRSTFYTFQQPTDTETYLLGSIAWNTQTVAPTPDGWIRKFAGWTSMS